MYKSIAIVFHKNKVQDYHIYSLKLATGQTTELAVRVMLLVQKCDVPLLQLQGGAGGEAGGVGPADGQLALLQLSDQLLWCWTSPASRRRETLREELQGRGEVPHLDGAIVVAGEDKPPGSGAHPAAPVTLVNTETGDDGPVN